MTAALPQSPVWFITGCSSGFGMNLALIALKTGHRVIATSRNPSKTPEVVSSVEALGGNWLQLDVCSPSAGEVVKKATEIYGQIDILVNNAGYALLGALETLSDEECRVQMETNFFAPLNLIRNILPHMRKRGSGVIVNISSTAGIEARPTRSLYSGSKFALEAMSEALYQEVKPLGIRVLLVEPGGFKTPFANNYSPPTTPLPAEYKGTMADQMMEYIESMAGSGTGLVGDVEKGCQAIFDVVTGTGMAEGMEEYLRLPLGKDGSARWEVKVADLKRNLNGTERIWSSTDADI